LPPPPFAAVGDVMPLPSVSEGGEGGGRQAGPASTLHIFIEAAR
jgi:hypothetical protein